MKDFVDEVEDVFESIGMEEIFMVFAILFGIMIIALIVAVVAKRKREAANAVCPVSQMHAKVVDKQQLPTSGIVVYSQIWVMFELDDGRRVRLITSGNEAIVVGDSGNLTWQGDSMISFYRDGTSRG